MEHKKKIVIFGAGVYGRKALDYFGLENIFCFADNNDKLSGTFINGIPVISFEELKGIYPDYEIVIATGAASAFVIAAQMEDAGIMQYAFFLKILEEDNNFKLFPKKEDSGASRLFYAETEDNCKDVLMVTYFFPPLSGGGVFRSLKFAKYLPAFNWRPTIISTDQPSLEIPYADQSLLKEIPQITNVIRIPDLIGTMRLTAFSPEIVDMLLPFLQDILLNSKEALDIVDRLMHTATGRAMLLTFPCPALLWAYQVIQYVEKNIDLSRFQVIFTTAEPFSAHLVGFYFKKKYKIPWIADYRDQWTDEPAAQYETEGDYYKLLFELEKLLLNNADVSLTVSKGAFEQYHEHFGISTKEMKCITNGYDESDFAEVTFTGKQPPKFTITYSGVLYTQNRNIAPILQALRELADEGSIELNQVYFCIIGGADPTSGFEMIETYGLTSVVSYMGYRSHQEALKSNMASNLLLLLLGDSDKNKVAYTGKFFDYLRSGRPILALAPLDGVVAQFLQKTGHGETFLSTNISGIKAFILREYQKWQRGEKRELLHSPLIEQFERKRLTEQLAVIFDEISR